MISKILIPKKLFCLGLVALWVAYPGVPVWADVVPAFLFSDNAVLQRDKPIPVWGTADAGEKITISFSGQTATTTAESRR